MLVHIQPGNNKIGAAMNVSLRPGKDCVNCSGCVETCYDLKFYRMWTGVRRARDANSQMAREHRGEYFEQIAEALESYKGRYFRWHVGGDILDQDYLDQMVSIARAFPAIRFLAFTKMYWLDYDLPANLVIVFSEWPGMPAGTRAMPRFIVKLRDELDEIENDTFWCAGDCLECGYACWHARAGDRIYGVIHKPGQKNYHVHAREWLEANEEHEREQS
jgi:ferredoxin